MSTIDPFVSADQPTVFHKLVEPVEDFVKEQNHRLPKHRNQKYDYEDFFRLLIYYFVSGTKSLKLLVQAQLNTGLLPPEPGLRAVPYSTCQDAFERFSPGLFQAVFQHLLSKLPFKAVPELASLGTLYCIDGSLFPVISSMLWAEYTSKHQALKLHLCFELNRMIPVDFRVGSGNSSERDALRSVLAAGVTYIADRGYMSFQLCHEVCRAQAHFIFRTKTNLLFTVVERLPVSLPASAQGLFSQLTDELIGYDHDPHNAPYRLVRFYIGHEAYYLLTDRRDLSTFQVILLYAYRWQIGVSGEGHIVQSVKVRPGLIDSGPVAWEVPWRESKTVKPSDNVHPGCTATHQVVTCSERRSSLVTRIPVAETVYNARRQQGPIERSPRRRSSPAGYQRRHDVKDCVSTGETLGARRRKPVEEVSPITVSGKWRRRHPGGGSGRSTDDRRAAKRAGREGPGPVGMTYVQREVGVR